MYLRAFKDLKTIDRPASGPQNNRREERMSVMTKSAGDGILPAPVINGKIRKTTLEE